MSSFWSLKKRREVKRLFVRVEKYIYWGRVVGVSGRVACPCEI